MHYIIKYSWAIYLSLIISSFGFYEKLHRTFHIPLPYVGDIVSSIFPLSLIFFLLIVKRKNYFILKKFELYFILLIIFYLLIFYINSGALNYHHFSFLSDYVWILCSYIIFKLYLNHTNTNQETFQKYIFLSIILIFFYNVLINIINNIFFLNDFYNTIVKRAEITSLTSFGYIISYFFYYFFLNNFFTGNKKIYFIIFLFINFYSLYMIESRGLYIFNFSSLIFIFLYNFSDYKMILKKIIVFISLVITLYAFGLDKLTQTVTSTIKGLDGNYNEDYYLKDIKFDNKLTFYLSGRKKNKEELENILDNTNNYSCVEKKNIVVACKREDVIKSVYSKEISFANSSNIRYFTSINIIKKLIDKPLFGISLSEVKKITINGDRTHSHLIILLASTGAIGLMCLMILIYLIFINSNNKFNFIFAIFFLSFYSIFFDRILPWIGLVIILLHYDFDKCKNEKKIKE